MIGVGRMIAAAAVALGLATGSASAAPETFKFAWPSAINSGVAPLTFATKLGLFEREGLKLELVVLTGSGVIIPQLLRGSIDGAYSGLEPVILAHQEDGPKFDIIFVYNFIPHTIWELAVKANSDIKSVADLKGKTIGVLALSSSNVLTTKAILKAGGVDPDSVNFQGVGVGAAAYEALKNGQVDVLNLFDTAHARLELSGTPLRRLEIPKGFSGSSHGISVAKKLLKEKPELLGKFGRVMAEANVACEANLEACIRSYWKAYPELAPNAAQEANAMEQEKKVLASRLANLLAVKAPYGEFPKEDWTNIVSALQQGGLVKNPDVPFDLYYTNELVPAFNDFDKQAIINLAKKAK